MTLTHRVRDADGVAQGAIVLMHGRGADENDLFPLFDILDPHRRLVGLAPRGPLALDPGGAHWYVVRELGYPDPSTFWPTFNAATSWLDDTLSKLQIATDRTIVGGFSQGAVMSYALALGNDRPRPAGLMPLSGFIPTVEGLDIARSDLDGFPVAIGHGTFDPVITVDWSRRAAEQLSQAGADVLFRESPMQHTIDPAFLSELRSWVDRVLVSQAS
ncbi:MAG: phospholipase/carboxylesterase [Actinomycetota bacterium]|nr:phospholipase/carboxylesterase [Actinomycetota bacterium]